MEASPKPDGIKSRDRRRLVRTYTMVPSVMKDDLPENAIFGLALGWSPWSVEFRGRDSGTLLIFDRCKVRLDGAPLHDSLVERACKRDVDLEAWIS